jgi:TolA-binding protein
VIYYGDEIIEKGQVSAEAENRALLMMGKASLNANKVDDAQDYFLRTLNSAKDEYGAEANYLIAVIMNGKHKYRESIDVLLDMNKTFGSYDFWLGKSFLLIAKNNVALKEYFQAKATLQSIIDNSPVSSVVDEAKKDLRELENIAVETDSTAPDTLEIENFD